MAFFCTDTSRSAALTDYLQAFDVDSLQHFEATVTPI
jgi:hypothetical protein